MRRGLAGLAFAFVLASCADLRDPPVVTIGADSWTLTDLRRAYAEMDSRWRKPLGAPEARQAFVERLIERRLLAEYADSVLTAENDPRLSWNQTANEILLRRLRVVVGSGARPTEEEIADAVARMAVLSRVERMQFPDESSAQEARARILNGESFAAVAADGPGALVESQWIPWRPTANELADRAASLEVGEVSEVFREGFVDQLVRVVERVPADMPQPSEGEVSRGLQAQLAAERMQELVAELRGQADVRIEDDAVELLTEATIDAIVAGEVTQHDAEWALPRLDAAQSAMMVARWQGGRLDAAEYLDALRVMIPAHRPSADFLARRVRTAVDSEITRRLLLGEARRRGLESDRWVDRARRKAREEYEVRYGMNHLESLIPVTTAAVDSMRQLLASVPVAMFRKEASALVLRYDLPSREAALAELVRIREAGGGWERLLRLFEGDPAFTGSVQLLSLSATSTSEDALLSAALDPFAPAPSGPFETTGRWAVIDRLEFSPDREMTEEEIREMLEDRIRQDRSHTVRAEWLARRKRERSVTVDQDLLDALSPGG